MATADPPPARSAFTRDSCFTERTKGGALRVTGVPRPSAGVVTSADGSRYVWLTAGDLIDADIYATAGGLRKLEGDDRERIWDLIPGGNHPDFAELALASDDEEELIAWVRTKVTVGSN